MRAYAKLGYPLKIVGLGGELERLRAVAAPNIEFLGWLPTADVVKITTDGSTTTRIRAMDKVQADGNQRALAVDRASSSDDYWVE